MSGFNLADLFERVADAVPDREVIVSPARRLTFAQLDERANRLANVLTELGIERDEHIGLQLLNGSEYIEGMLAAFKIGAVPVNVNFRYVEGELRHLYDDADLVAVIHHQQFSPRVAAVMPKAETVRNLIVVTENSGADIAPDSLDYETALAQANDSRPDGSARTGDDRYIAYTGGTTGLPKGVVWRQEDIFFAAMGGGDVFQSGNFIAAPEEIVERIPETGGTILTTPPLMHVSAQWGVFHSLMAGGRIVFPPQGPFDADGIWNLVASEGVNILTIVGDAMARPLADAYAAASDAGAPYDSSSLFVIGSGGAVLSTQAKAKLTELLPSLMVVDGFGSSETGIVGSKLHVSGDTTTAPTFTVNAQTQVLGEDGKPVEPGSGQVGRLARKGFVPLGYYKDEAKTRATFLVIDGERWVLPGDNATVSADGTVVLLGRGSTSINTGGEKVYPEEVEMVLMANDAVADVIVVGVPDERWGEQVVAVVAAARGATPTLEALQEHGRESLAGYKLPRTLVLVDRVERTPAGKPDYAWAKKTAMAERSYRVAHINLEAVADTLAIQHLLARYPMLVDAGELDALDDLFTTDARLDFSSFGGPNAGLSEMKEFLKGNLALFARTQHMMGLPLITLTAHTATARTPCHNPMVIEQKDGTQQAWLIGLWYDDEFVETADGWRFASRIATRCYSVVGLTDTPLSG